MALALAAAVLTFLCMSLLGRTMVEEVYLSGEATDRRMGQEISSFRSFVEEKGIDTVLFLNNLMATADSYTVRCLEKLVD